MQEEWRDVKGYEGLYQISSLGRLRQIKFNHYLSPFISRGYFRYIMSKEGKKQKQLAHRLVAEAFLPNPLNLPQINHKDENKLNNDVSNLEWCTAQYNSTYGTRLQRISAIKSQKVMMLDAVTNECIASFKSATEAATLLGLHQGHISQVCLGDRRTTGGYKWRYADV